MNDYKAIKWITWKKLTASRKVQSSKTEPGRNRNYEQPNYNLWIEAVIKNLPKIEKSRTRCCTWWIVPTIYRRINASPSQTLPKNLSKRNTSKLHLQGQHHPYTKARQEYYKKRELQINIPDAHRCKNPQQSISQPNSTIH